MKTKYMLAALVAGSLALTACGGNSTTESSETGKQTITVGSAAFAESEIIAEIYAQALEAEGYQVERKMQIGSREAYQGALTDGSIDLIPEYSGNLLQYFDAGNAAATEEEIVAALPAVLPENLRVLEAAEAQNRDSWTVSAEFSEANQIISLVDLADYEGPLRLAGNPTLAERPYGPKGLVEFYGVKEDQITFTPIDDAGGPLTVKALLDGDVDMANIYTTTPAIKTENLVVLADPENMILPQQVLPLVSDRVPAEVDEILNRVSAKLTTDELIAMNIRSQGEEKAAPSVIAKDWLAENS